MSEFVHEFLLFHQTRSTLGIARRLDSSLSRLESGFGSCRVAFGGTPAFETDVMNPPEAALKYEGKAH